MGKSILLVEDDAIIATHAREQLERAGYRVTLARSAGESVALLRADPQGYDLAILDVGLGGGSGGADAARQMLQIGKLPLVFLYSEAEPDAVRATKEIPSHGYVAKSAGAAVIDASISTALRLFEADHGERRTYSDGNALREDPFLRTLIENIPDSVYFNDSEGRKILSNSADLELIGAAEVEEVIGRTDLELYPGEIGERGHRDNLSVVETGVPIINREELFLRADGSSRWLLTSKIPLRNRDGCVIGLVGIGRDITDRKLAEDRREEDRLFLRTLIRVLPDPVYFKDTSGRKILSNIAAVKNLDDTEENNELGKTDLELFPGPLGMRGFRDDERVLQSGEPVLEKEEDFEDGDGNVAWLSTSKVPVRNAEGEIIGLVGIGHNITRLKRLEESLRNSLEQKTVLMKELEHRVKNSLNVVGSLIRLEIDSLRDEESRRVFQTVLGRIASIAGVYERLYHSEDLSSVDAREYVRYLAESIFDSGSIRGEKLLVSGVGGDLRLEASRAVPLGLILNELLTNALKHAYSENGGEIRVTLDASGGSITLCVADDGVGLPEGIDPTRGSSTGMTLVNVLAQQLGGQVKISSEGGTRICVGFPAA